jgi:hypothetical protein
VNVIGSGRSSKDGGFPLEAALRALDAQLDRVMRLLDRRAGTLDVARSRPVRRKLIDTARALERPFACECGALFTFPGQLDDHRRNVHGVDP